MTEPFNTAAAEAVRDRADDVTLISFVIPAFNEERFIAQTVDSIHAAMTGSDVYEIILVDNGSTDRTPSLAAERGATVLTKTTGTIGSLRNHGARRARGRYLVFLDADVTLTEGWRAAFRDVSASLTGSPAQLSGSICSTPRGAGWLERMWFSPRAGEAATYLGGAHFIMQRDAFLAMGGFDEALETGEDYDLSVRVTAGGGSIHHLPSSVAEHHGYPKTLRQFIRREIWHGTGDCMSVATVLGSKVAIVALAFALLHLLAIAAFAAGYAVVGGVAVGLIVILCLASSQRSFGGGAVTLLLANSLLYYVYYWARTGSFVRAYRVRHPQRRTRDGGHSAALA